MPSDKSHQTRHHVQLPSGKQIEVVYLDNAVPPSLGRRTELTSDTPTRPRSHCTSASTAGENSSTRWIGRKPASGSGGSCPRGAPCLEGLLSD